MNINGTERWRGNRPNPVSMRQRLYLAILEEMTGEQFYVRNSKEAYELIGKYKYEIQNNVDIEYSFDDRDSHILYADVYILDEYVFTVRNVCREAINRDETIDTAKIISFEIYEDDAFI